MPTFHRTVGSYHDMRPRRPRPPLPSRVTPPTHPALARPYCRCSLPRARNQDHLRCWAVARRTLRAGIASAECHCEKVRFRPLSAAVAVSGPGLASAAPSAFEACQSLPWSRCA
eukprot:5290300-Prymnesium_polylepis.3